MISSVKEIETTLSGLSTEINHQIALAIKGEFVPPVSSVHETILSVAGDLKKCFEKLPGHNTDEMIIRLRDMMFLFH